MAETFAATEEHRKGNQDNEPQEEEERGSSGGCLNFLRPCSSWCRASFEEEEEEREKINSAASLLDLEGLDLPAGPAAVATPTALVDKAAPLVAGIPALLVFRDGHSQNCLLKLNRLRSALLLLMGGRFGRTIPLEEIQTVLSGEELQRVDGFNADNTHCAALSLVSGFAIPLLFRTEEEKNNFVVSLTSLLGDEDNEAEGVQENN